jgi:hypothetical protein
VLEVSGCVGELVDTELGEYDIPVPPVTFDATSGTGDDVCWTQWLKLGAVTRPIWRALIVRGHTLKHLDDRALLVQRVTVRGQASSPNPTPGRAESAEGAFRTTTPLRATLDRLAATESKDGHLLPPGCTRDSVTEALQTVGAPDSPLRGFLERFNGAVLFDGALAFNYLGATPAGFADALMFEVEDLVDDNTSSSRESSGVSTPTEVVLFARSLGGRMYWGIDPSGHVRGFSASGDVYGPDAPFEDWLADSVADLAFVAEQAAAGERRLSKMLG